MDLHNLDRKCEAGHFESDERTGNWKHYSNMCTQATKPQCKCCYNQIKTAFFFYTEVTDN